MTQIHNMESQESDQLVPQFEVVVSPKIETFVDYLYLCPLPNLLKFQQCINEIVENKKNGSQTPVVNKEWYVDENNLSKYLDLQKEHEATLKKYVELQKKCVELQAQSASLG